MMSKKFQTAFVLLMFTVVSSSYKSSGIKYPIKMMIMDTDGATDDVIAIMMALHAEKYDHGPKIIAITCLNGVSYLDDATINVLKTLKALNRTDIPVYAGAATPLLDQNEKDHSYGIDGFGDFEFPDPPSRSLIKKKHAVKAIFDLVNKYPGEVTVFSMAPTTQLALVIKMYPDFCKKVHQIIIMGGSVEGYGNVRPGIDFNSFVDPVGNYIVFKSKCEDIHLVYLETTMRARVSMKFRVSLNNFNNTKSWLLRNSERIALKTHEKYWYCPDAVAVVVATTSGRIVTRSQYAYVEAIYDGLKTQGMTIADYKNTTGKPANINLIEDIDVEEYQRILYECFST